MSPGQTSIRALSQGGVQTSHEDELELDMYRKRPWHHASTNTVEIQVTPRGPEDTPASVDDAAEVV